MVKVTKVYENQQNEDSYCHCDEDFNDKYYQYCDLYHFYHYCYNSVFVVVNSVYLLLK